MQAEQAAYDHRNADAFDVKTCTAILQTVNAFPALLVTRIKQFLRDEVKKVITGFKVMTVAQKGLRTR